MSMEERTMSGREAKAFAFMGSEAEPGDAFLRDIVALSTLPAMWLGAEPLRIAESLAASLFTTLHPAFVYVSFTDGPGRAPIAVAQTDRYRTNSHIADRVGAPILGWARAHDPDDLLILPDPLGHGTLTVAVRPLGADAELGVIAAAFAADHGPTSAQRLILGVSASQAGTAVQNARLVRSLRDSEERNRRANADLTRHVADLEKANLEIRAARRAALNVLEDFRQSRLVADRLNERLRGEIDERTQAEEALRRSEEQFRAVFDQTTGGIAQTDLTGRFTLVNDRYCDIVGRSREELLTLRMHDITHPDDLPANAEKFRALARGGPSFVVEKRYLRPDGSTVWVHNDVSAVRDSRGRVSHVVAAVADITERKQTESLLAEHKHLLEKIATGCALDESLTALTDAVTRLQPRVRAAVFTADADRTAADLFSLPVPPSFGANIAGAPINEPAIFTGRPVTCPDIAGSGCWSPPWRELCLAHGIRACHSTPVFGPDGEAVAWFLLCFSEAREPDAWERRIAEFGAQVASIAVERDRANQVRQRDLEDARRLQEISAQLIQEDDVQTLYERILDVAVGCMRSDFGSMQMLIPERMEGRGELLLLAHRGFTPEGAEAWKWVGADSPCICGEALRTGKRVIVHDFESCGFMAGTSGLEDYRAAGIRAAQSTLLRSRAGRVLGMISTHWRKPHRPSERDLRLLDVLARQAADLIERSQAEKSIRESEERFRAFINATSDVVYRMSPDWTEMRHLEGREFIADTLEPSQTWLDKYIHPEDQRHVMEAIQRAIRSKNVFELEHRVIRVDGSLGWTHSRAIPILNDHGEIIEWFGAAGDVTQRKEAEKALREAQQRLQRWNVELEQAVNTKTAELRQSQDRLRAMATELNLAEQRERKRLATELHDHLQQTLVLGRLIVGQGRRAAAAPAGLDVMKKIDDIFAEALTYTRTLVADLSPTVLRDHGLTAGLRWLGEYMKKHQITVTVTVPEKDDFRLPEDQAVLLFQSARELLINSAKHAGTKQAAVRMERYDGQLRIEVSDQGHGFDPAAAAAAAGTPHGGISSKFGLFSIQERMRALGGTFDVRSAPGQGATATLVLPLSKDVRGEALGVRSGEERKVHECTAPSNSRVASHLTPDAFRIRVLLVDDHTVLRQGLRSIVTSYDHFEVVGEAGDGVEAVELAQRLDADVVVMDINMPKMDGIEATRRIKANRPTTVVIGLSVNPSDDTEYKMKTAGASAYLTKESAADALCHAIEQAVSYRRHTVAPPVYEPP